MRSIILIGLILSLQSCNVRKMIGADYGNQIDNDSDNIAKNSKDIGILKGRISALESSLTANIQVLDAFSQQLAFFENELAALVLSDDFQSGEYTAYYNQLLGIISDLETDISSLSSATDTIVLDIAELQGYAITEIIDPCGKQGTYDEVILRTGSGQLLAYFESGSNRYLSVIPAGSYSTTDGTNCLFQVTVDGDIVF